jgi:hypothetical protein
MASIESRLLCYFGRSGRFAVVALAALIALPAVAQEAAPAWIQVVVVQVKPGHGPDFEDRISELMAARQAAGLPLGNVFEVEAGSPGEFHVVTPLQSMGQLENEAPPMAPPEMVAWTNRVLQHVDSTHWFYARLYPEHGIQNDAGASANLLILIKRRVVDGKQAEYQAWVADHMMPAARQSDMLGHTFSQGIFGDSPQNFYHAMPVANWSAFDTPNPMQQSLGQRAYDQLMNRLDGIVESTELTVAAVRSDLMP